MRQRALPLMAGDRQGLPDRVFAPHRRLASIGPVLRGCVAIKVARYLRAVCALAEFARWLPPVCIALDVAPRLRAVLMDITQNGWRALGNRYLLDGNVPITMPVAIESLRQRAMGP
jgi:hypothetical protein